MGDRAWIRVLGSVVLFALLLRGPAHAAGESYVTDDYTVTEVSGLYSAPPPSATNLNLGDSEVTEQAIPFPLRYWGGTYDSFWIASNGYIHFKTAGGPTPTRCYPNGRYPVYGGGGSSQTLWGNIAPYHENLDLGAQGDVYKHIEGTAPNRVYVVSWVNCTIRSGNAGLSFQARIHEGTNRIEFAYKPDTVPSTWPIIYSGFALGIDSPGYYDERGILPTGRGEPKDPVNKGHPGTDYRIDPVVRTFTGTLLMDKLVSDASGIGNTVIEDVPLAGVRLELRWNPPGGDTDEVVVGEATTDATGAFAISGYGLPSDGQTGRLVAYSTATAVDVLDSDGEPHELEVDDAIDLDDSQELGDVVVDATVDPSGSERAPFNVLLTLDRVRDWAAPHVSEGLSKIDVLYDDVAPAATAFTEASGNDPAQLRVAGGGAVNPDGWDDAIITKAYGRHVLSSAAAPPGTTADGTFDGASDLPNAFAEGFGYYLFAAAFETDVAADGRDASIGAEIDLDDPSLTAGKSPDVAGWVTANLFDLVDGANEGQDRVDGSVPERPLQIIDAFTEAVDADEFYRSWGKDTPDAAGLSRLTIHHGIVDDDTAEPDDDALEPFDPGAFPFEIEDRVLNPYNEDWIAVTLPTAVPGLLVELVRQEVDVEPEDLASLTLELRTTDGTVLDVGTFDATGTVLSASTAARPAGTVHVRIAHTDGRTHVPYRVQALVPPAITGLPLRAWTQDRAYDESVVAVGGVGTLTFDVPPPAELPAGLFFGRDGDRVTGTPTESGEFAVTFQVRDSGTPAHVAQASQTLVINPPLTLPLGPYAGFPVGRAGAIVRGDVGGTTPRLFTVKTGALPTGLALDANVVRLSGTIAAEGSTDVVLHGVDVAGSNDEAAVRVVGCVDGQAKRAAVTLPAGDAAAGYWFDALRGSAIRSIKVKRASGDRKRAIAPILLGPDNREIDGVTIKDKRGTLVLKNATAFTTGRYFLILDGDPTATESTGLQMTLKLKAPKRTKGGFLDFGEGDSEELAFGAFDGAKMTLTFKRKVKKADTAVRVVALVAPSGRAVAPGAIDTLKDAGGGRKLVVKHALDESGTWRVLLAGEGQPGEITHKLKIKQPKKAVFVADE